MPSQIRAKVAKIPFDGFSIEGLLVGTEVDGTPKFAVSVSQIAELFSQDETDTSWEVQELLDGRFQHFKVATELNPEKVNAVCLFGFEHFLYKLAFKGSPKAQEILWSVVGLSLHQLFCNFFNIETQYRQK